MEGSEERIARAEQTVAGWGVPGVRSLEDLPDAPRGLALQLLRGLLPILCHPELGYARYCVSSEALWPARHPTDITAQELALALCCDRIGLPPGRLGLGGSAAARNAADAYSLMRSGGLSEGTMGMLRGIQGRERGPRRKKR